VQEYKRTETYELRHQNIIIRVPTLLVTKIPGPARLCMTPEAFFQDPVVSIETNSSY